MHGLANKTDKTGCQMQRLFIHFITFYFQMKNAWITAFMAMGLILSFTLTPIIMMKITSKRLTCAKQNEYVNREHRQVSDMIVMAENLHTADPNLSNSLISMTNDLLATDTNAHLMIFMLNLPKRISVYQK